jgi:hypothetical protein
VKLSTPLPPPAPPLTNPPVPSVIRQRAAVAHSKPYLPVLCFGAAFTMVLLSDRRIIKSDWFSGPSRHSPSGKHAAKAITVTTTERSIWGRFTRSPLHRCRIFRYVKKCIVVMIVFQVVTDYAAHHCLRHSLQRKHHSPHNYDHYDRPSLTSHDPILGSKHSRRPSCVA